MVQMSNFYLRRRSEFYSCFFETQIGALIRPNLVRHTSVCLTKLQYCICAQAFYPFSFLSQSEEVTTRLYMCASILSQSEEVTTRLGHHKLKASKGASDLLFIK
jgi:hypothetical protein